jgi:transposase
VLLAADGMPGKQIAAMVACAEPTVVTWRRRYAESGLEGLPRVQLHFTPTSGSWLNPGLLQSREASA